MTLRQSLGTDVERVYEHVEALLDGEDFVSIGEVRTAARRSE